MKFVIYGSICLDEEDLDIEISIDNEGEMKYFVGDIYYYKYDGEKEYNDYGLSPGDYDIEINKIVLKA